MKGTEKLGEYEDWEASDSTLQIGYLFGPNGVQQDIYIIYIYYRAPNGRSDDKQEKQDKKDYYEVSDSVLQSKC